MSQNHPVGPDGNPMAVVVGSVKDTIPTVQYGSVQIFAAITRPVPNGTDEEIINATRQVIRDAEYAVGCERRLLQWAIDPSLKFHNPATGEQFAAPPPGYDPNSMKPHPTDITNAIPQPPSAQNNTVVSPSIK
jgi:hypothetical protein